jgi:hypothetical protein
VNCYPLVAAFSCGFNCGEYSKGIQNEKLPENGLGCISNCLARVDIRVAGVSTPNNPGKAIMFNTPGDV